MKTVKRNGAVDFLRFIFCMVIIIYHGRNLGGTPEVALFGEAGYICVEFFFFVSGFLMAKTAARKENTDTAHLGVETAQFIWRKIKPMLAYYIFAVCFSYGCKIIAEDFTPMEALRNFMLGIWDLTFLRASGIKTYGLTRATWYLSAMLIAMLALYPMLRKWKEKFTHIIAPLIAIFCLGYISQTYGNLNQYVSNFNLVYSGLLRAFADLSIGCIGYVVCEKIKTVPFTKFSRILITLVQILGYAGVIYCTTNLPAKQFDFVLLLCLAVCVPLSFSGQGIAAPLFHSSFFTWLGKMSLVMYLNHMWVKDRLDLVLPASLGYGKLMVIYITCVFLASFVCLLWAKGLQLFWNKFGSHIQSWFRKQETV